jgi:XRE family transcriptional regulator of biofilm formation
MVGQRIKQLRLEQGLSLTELADRAGVAKSYLSSIEREIQSNPSVQFLHKISSALGVPVEFFLDQYVEGVTELDGEWFTLLKDAMEIGVSKERFRKFLDEYR